MAKRPKAGSDDRGVRWQDEELYEDQQFVANWARQLIAEARAGNVEAGEHLLVAAFVRLRRSEPDSPLTRWFGDFLASAIGSRRDTTFAQLIAPMPKGGRRPKYPDDTKLRVYTRVTAGIRIGLTVKEAIMRAHEKFSDGGRALTWQMVQKWYYEERRRRQRT